MWHICVCDNTVKQIILAVLSLTNKYFCLDMSENQLKNHTCSNI